MKPLLPQSTRRMHSVNNPNNNPLDFEQEIVPVIDYVKALIIPQHYGVTQKIVQEKAYLTQVNQAIKKAQKLSSKKRHKICKDLSTFSLNKK